MKFNFIGNACCEYEAAGKKLLCDPWLTPGAFLGSWFHYPPLRHTVDDIKDADYLYISHLHPDHYDTETLKHFRRDIPIIILDHGPNFLHRKLIDDGFTDIRYRKDGCSAELGPFKITMFAPFTKHPFYESEIGNLIDSAILVEAGGIKYLNTNDNMPDIETAKMLGEKYGPFHVAQLNFNNAGMYPSCAKHLSIEQRSEESIECRKRNILHLVKLYKVINANVIMPFAGEYVIGGKNKNKNFDLGTMSSREACTILDEYGVPCVQTSEDMSELDKWKYINSLEHKKYDYEDDEPATIGDHDWFKACENWRKACERYGYKPGQSIWVNRRTVLQSFVSDKRVDFELPPALLAGIINRKYHWNNAEIGCHIEFWRDGEYDPDLHTMMSFFHA
jgi:UDP-MurNAc hydroxylase